MCLWALLGLVLLLGACGEPELSRWRIDEEASRDASDDARLEAVQEVFNAYFPEDAPNLFVSEGGPMITVPWAHVLAPGLLDAAISTTPEAMQFPGALPPDLAERVAAVGPMDLIVSGEPGRDFLRRVVAVEREGEGTVWHIAEASPEDVFLHGIFDLDEAENLPQGPVGDGQEEERHCPGWRRRPR